MSPFIRDKQTHVIAIAPLASLQRINTRRDAPSLPTALCLSPPPLPSLLFPSLTATETRLRPISAGVSAWCSACAGSPRCPRAHLPTPQAGPPGLVAENDCRRIPGVNLVTVADSDPRRRAGVWTVDAINVVAGCEAASAEWNVDRALGFLLLPATERSQKEDQWCLARWISAWWGDSAASRTCLGGHPWGSWGMGGR